MPPDDTGTDVSWPAAIRLAVGILATWRIAHLLAEEDGPGDIVLRLRVRAGASWIGGLMDCFGCLSVWVAAPVAALVSPRRRDVALTWLGLSGGAYLLERATSTGDVASVYEPLPVTEAESAAIT